MLISGGHKNADTREMNKTEKNAGRKRRKKDYVFMPLILFVTTNRIIML